MEQKMSRTDLLAELAKPFSKKDIQWRVMRHWQGRNGYCVLTVAYVTNRAIQNRLDGVMGINNWQNEYRDMSGGILCGISLRIDGEWIIRWDGAEPTHIEPFKGGLSDAMKRAASQWGIGRYLYNLKEQFAYVRDTKPEGKAGYGWEPIYDKNKKPIVYWHAKELPDWALPPGEKGKQDDLPDDLKTSIPEDDGPVMVTITPQQSLDLISIAQEHGYTEADIQRVAQKDFDKESIDYLHPSEYDKIIARMRAKSNAN
jgi:hypothetical protein